jgi:hypothetical protein
LRSRDPSILRDPEKQSKSWRARLQKWSGLAYPVRPQRFCRGLGL